MLACLPAVVSGARTVCCCGEWRTPPVIKLEIFACERTHKLLARLFTSRDGPPEPIKKPVIECVTQEPSVIH